jgi:predicted ATPase
LETDADWVSYSMRLKQTGKSVVDGEHLSTLRGPPPPEEIARRLVDQQETLARINDREVMHLARDESALASLHDVQLHREAMAIREGLRAWSFFHFEPSSLRLDHPKDDLLFQRTGHDFELHESGADLARALSRLGTTDPDRLKAIGAAFQALIPEAERVEAQIGLDGRPLILLQERGLTDPFSQHDLSDGLLRILALLYLAHHPEPPTLVFVEEPENGLYPRLIEALADVLLSLSQRTQVMITTHSVQLLNRLTPDQVVFVSRTDRGSQLTRLQTRRDVIEAAAEFGVGDQLRMGHIEGQ